MARRSFLSLACGYVVFVIVLVLPSEGGLAQAQRDIGVMPKVAARSVPITGDYWALLIGIDRYQNAPDLTTAVRDAVAVGDVLVERYGFSRERIIELLNGQATGPAIQQALYQLGQKAGKDDSVFIYYAGHGQYDEDGGLGWWVPTEADPKNPGTFILDVAVLNYIKGMQAKHVYLVADSCFSGTLFGTRALPPINDQWFAKLYAKTSRWALTSGGTEPVADLGKEGHSVFAYYFLTLLRENMDPYLVPSRIHDRIAPLVSNNAAQTPRTEPLKNAGDDGGQFVFRLAVRAGEGVVPNLAAEQPIQEVRVPKLQFSPEIDDIMQKEPGYTPRVTVVIMVNGQPKGPSFLSGGSEILKKLIQAGFKQGQLQKTIDITQVQKVLSGEISPTQITAGSSFASDLLILGEAYSETAIRGGVLGKMISARASLQAMAIKIRSGTVLANEGVTGRGLDISEKIAQKKAISHAAQKWTKAVLPILLKEWPIE